MSKKPKPRYESEAEIIRDIDVAKQKARLLKDAANGMFHQAEQMAIEASQADEEGLAPHEIEYLLEQRAWILTKAEKMAASANNIYKERIPYLSQKLAEFRTMTIPGILPDKSIET